ncbi:Ger(x)C family spore germination protein [Ureibacillus acetophenoni]|nr:Ger(x)C family spore germination protein [Ureibacillus acetophenoni]
MKQITLLIVILLLLTGCWDKIELEKRAFVYGVGIDLAEEQSSSKSSKIKLTSQLIVPEQLVTLSGGGSGPAYRNLSATGDTIINNNRETLKQTSRVTDVTHLRVILFSEDVIKQPNLFKEHIDVFLREKDMRRGMLIAIASGKAGDLLSVEPEDEKLPSHYIGELLEIRGNIETVESIRIGDIQEKVLQQESFTLPQLKKLEPKIIDYEGIAVYNGRKAQMVGTLKGDEAKGLNIIIEEKNTGTLNIEVDGKVAAIELLRIDHKFQLENNDPSNLQFKINLKVNGTIAEQYGNQDVMKEEVHKKFEIELKEKISELTEKAVEKLQKDYMTDVLGLGTYLHHYHPKLWEQMKNNWEIGENYFSKSKITFDIDVLIERPGTINKTSDGSRFR